MRVPHDVYHVSPRKFDPTPVELVYPGGYAIRKVNRTGNVKIHNTRVARTRRRIGTDRGQLLRGLVLSAVSWAHRLEYP